VRKGNYSRRDVLELSATVEVSAQSQEIKARYSKSFGV
jgi:hypothetical protein